MDYKKHLNKEQLKAVNQIEGPVLVFAGAGTGKTRTLTYRVANMVEKGIEPFNILAVTFTNKATNEMRERLYDMIKEKAHIITISTFHSLCAKILRKTIHVIGYQNNFDIIDEEDQVKVVNEAIANLKIDRKKHNPKQVVKVINYSKSFNKQPKSLQERGILEEYQKILKEYNSLDFADLLIKTHQIFSEHKEILERYQNRFKYVLVDEFQDTNSKQYEIVKMLAEKHRNIFVVGDDDQSIYAFRGANYANINRFSEDFKERKRFILSKNYRSSQYILDGCNTLIKNNKNREEKELHSDIAGKAGDVNINSFVDDRTEVENIINEIKKHHNNGTPYKNMAILYRASAISRAFEANLVRANIPYQIYGGISYLRRKEVKDITAYLKYIINPRDMISFKRIVNIPARGIGAKTVEKLFRFKRELKTSVFEAIEIKKAELGKKYKDLKKFKNIIVDLRELIDDTPLDEFYDILLDKIKYIDDLKKDPTDSDRIQNIREFKSILYSIENDGETASRKERLISAFDEAILSEEKVDKSDSKQDKLILSTVHSVKGLEFDCVFLTAFENGIFPSKLTYSDFNIEEERRVCYVACTRAKQKLYLSYAQRRLLYGHTNHNNYSKFLIEFLGIQDKVDKETNKVDYDITKINNGDNPYTENHFQKNSIFEQEKGDEQYSIGDKVTHKVFGKGTIVALNKKAIGLVGTICFTDNQSIKTFDMSHNSIRKIDK